MPLPSLALLVSTLLAWGWFTDLFSGDEAPAPPAPEAVGAAIAGALPLAQHSGTAALYAARDHAPLWGPAERDDLLGRLAAAADDGITPEASGAARAREATAAARGAADEWARLERDAREATPDPRAALEARAEIALTDALLRTGDALSGARLDLAALHPGTWFPQRDSTAAPRVRAAVASGEADRAIDALDALAPASPAYARLRSALVRLRGADRAPVPEGAALRVGERSIRVPHLRARLAALGYLGERADASGWAAAEPYLLDRPLAGALARFRDAGGLGADSLLDRATTRALNADLDSLAERVALNMERWRHLPRETGGRHVWVNLPAYHLEVREATGEAGLEMTVNIGNAKTTGWTTPVISDSITRVVFRPAWYVPRSLVTSQVLPMARADSLSLFRQGFEVYNGGASVDSRLVKWDSVDTSGFRFVQRPGPSNPLGRAKFPMTNPYAILIHDTNRGDFGGPVSSGCVHAGDAEALAAYLLRAEGWDEARAEQAYRRGPKQQGVPLAEPVKTHFVYLTAEADESGALVFHDDPYGYDARQLAALRRAG